MTRPKKLNNLLDNTSDSNIFNKAIRSLVGFRAGNLNLYKQALRPSGFVKTNENTNQRFPKDNERLEYLGDAILGAIIAEFLFKKYPLKDEGFLTTVRSRLVNREFLNQLARKIGIDKLIELNECSTGLNGNKSVYGDALEAFIGAVYLNKGYSFTQNFILKKLLHDFGNIENVVQQETNFKSRIIEWCQKENHEIEFNLVEENGDNHRKEFTVALQIDGVQKSTGTGLTKKKAEQAAAEVVCQQLQIC